MVVCKKNVVCTYIYGWREKRRGGRFLSPSTLKTRYEVVLSPDGQGQASHTKFSYSNKKLWNSAKHKLWGRGRRIISSTEPL